ncbi:MAG: hypothetical protein M3394_01115 [Actinomycetota bacterium]|nr:hypothetical protein [Actinomycetota bacterium]
MKRKVNALGVRIGRRVPSKVRTAVPLAIVVAAAVGSLAPAFAETYAEPGYFAVGTNGSDANSDNGFVAFSEGGCASGLVAVAIGDRHRCEHDARGEVGVGLFGAEAGGGQWAVSDTGDASLCQSEYCLSMFAISGTGNASGGSAVSGTGDASGGWALSGSGNASGGWAVSGTENASGGTIAVSPTRDATSTNGPVTWNGPKSLGLAIGGRNATAEGNSYALAATGDATTQGEMYTIAGVPLGGAAIAGNNANANGGAVAVSLTGNACGASVYAVAPLGHAC